MSSFQKTKEKEIPTIESKFMALGSELTRSAWFSRYLNYFNSITAYEYSLERESDAFHNEVGFNLFQ